MKKNRRNFIRESVSMAAAVSVTGLSSCSGSGKKEAFEANVRAVNWPVSEGPDTPKICLNCGLNATDGEMQLIKQMGVDYVNGGASATQPWKVEDIRSNLERYKANGLTVIKVGLGFIGMNIILAREGRDKEIATIKENIVAAGAAGIPVIEYNWYISRLEAGYFGKTGRGGSGVTGYDYTQVKDLPPNPETGLVTSEQIWDNYTYFLKEVIPVAEKAGVRMCVHPNDPPAQISYGNPQILASFEGWKRLMDIVKSPSNGVTYDPGVCKEMGEDPVEVMRYMASRNQLIHSHYRNVITYEPYNRYDEVFYDVGQVNMYAVMKEYFNSGYTGGIFPEHQRFFTRDAEYPGYKEGGYPGGGNSITGLVYNVAYTRAMMQAAMSS
jgi:mannonate dehydratase